MRSPVLVALLLGTSIASAGETAAPPDVLHGDRYDGRAPQKSARKYVLAVPRAILAVPRLLVRRIAAAARPALSGGGRNPGPQRGDAALTPHHGPTAGPPTMMSQ